MEQVVLCYKSHMLDVLSVFLIALLGLIAGLGGGLLGVGGSVIMIPGLVLLFGQNVHAGFNQHLYQAGAMIVNIFVAIAATWRHRQARAIVPDVLRGMLPAAVAAILAGVWVSNWPMFSGAGGPVMLGRVLAVFLIYVIVVNTRRMFRKPRPVDVPIDLTHVTTPRTIGVGLAMGFIAGLLGVGGGAIAVPLQQIVLKLRLRNCIANSAAVMCISSILGAIYKNATLPAHDLAIGHSVTLAALLAPTAIVGAFVGGKLTHVLPVRGVRLAFILLMIAAAWKMAAIWQT